MSAADLQTPDGKTPQDAFDTEDLSVTEIETKFRAWAARRDAEYHRLLDNAQQVMRATRGWWSVGTEREWLATCAAALEAQRTGRHVIEQLGAENQLDPKLMAHLWAFREGLIADTGAETTGELALIDMAVVAFANVLRVQGWIGNWCLHIEREAFGQKSLRAEFRDRHGHAGDSIRGLPVEQYVGRIADDLLPLVERFHRMMREALQSIQQLRSNAAAKVERESSVALVVVIR